MAELSAEKAIVKELFDALNEGEPERWLDIVQPEFVLNGRDMTAARWVELGHRLHRDEPEITIHVEELLQEGDRVVARLRSAGRETSPFLGYAPSGKMVETKGVYIFTVRAGRIVDAWDVWDMLGRLVQTGAWPPPGHKV